MTAEFYSGPIHFLTSEGVWEEIDTTIVPSTRPSYAFRNRQGAFRVDFAAGADVRDTVRLESGSRTIGFTPVDGSPLSVPRAEGSQVTYPDVYPGVDLTYHVQNDGLKELLILRERPQVPVSFSFLLGLTGLTAEQPQGGAISLTDAGGDVQFIIPPAWMEDSADPENDGAATSTDVTVQLLTQGGQTALEVTPSFAWLQDPARVYPVTIDPSVYRQGSQPDTHVDSSNLNDHSQNAALFTGLDTTGARRRALLRFDGVQSALAGTRILGATLNLYTTSHVDCSISNPVFAWRAADFWSSNVNWNNKPNIGFEGIGTNGNLSASSACTGSWANLDVVRAVTNWVSGEWPNYGFYVTAERWLPESVPQARKRFASNNNANQAARPILEVSYNRSPTVPYGLSPPSGSGSTDLTPTLSAVYYDSDLDPGSLYFKVYRRSTGQVIDEGYGNPDTLGAGQSASFDAYLLDGNDLPICGETFDWSVKAYDDIDWSGEAWGNYTTTTPGSPTPVSPADGVTLNTFTPPTLTVQGSGAPLYRFVVTSGTAVVAESGTPDDPWITTPSWTVPRGVLADGGRYAWYSVAGGGDSCDSTPTPPRTFTLDVQRLGSRGHYPMVDFALGHGTGASVNAGSGNLVMTQTDSSVPTVDDPFVLSRSYNSRGAGKLIYVEDELPAGATPFETWEWDNIVKWSGSSSHKEASDTGAHQHYFQGAMATLFVPYGSSLVTYAFLDPANTPREVMLQFHTSDADGWRHRGYWAANDLTGWGQDGTNEMRRMGSLPGTGQWVRLEVPASAVGLEGKIIDGVAYTLFDGQAWFDKTYLGGPSGYGWSLGNELILSEFSFIRLIERTDNAHLELVDSSGGVHFYYQVTGTNQYKSESGDFATVTKDAPSDEWELKNAEGFRYYFGLSDGNLIRIRPPELGKATDPPAFSFLYSGGRLTGIRDRINRQLSFTYDPEGRIYQAKADFDSGRVLATYEYDDHDQLKAVTDANGHQTKYTYDPVTHDLLTVTTPRGTASATERDFTTSIDYHQSALAGEEYRRVRAVRRPHTEGATTTDLVTSFAYTPETRTTKVTSPRGNATPVDPNDFVTTFEYNERLNPVKITDPAGNPTVMDWNADNLRTRLVDGENNEWVYAYDGNGNLCRETLPASVLDLAGQRAKIEYFYDEFSGPYTCLSGTKPTYNLPTRTIDAEGRVTKTEYWTPTAGKPWVEKETVAYGTLEAATTSYSYYEDPNPAKAWRYGKVQTKTMPKGNASGCDQVCKDSYTTTYNYWGPSDLYSLPNDPDLVNVPQQGWVKSTSQPGDIPVTCGGVAATTCHHYDRRGNEIHTLDAKGDHYQLYDPDDRLVKSQDLGATGAPDPSKWVTFAYDADGNRTRVTDPDISGDQTAFSYDDLNRLATSVDAWGRTTTYRYDHNGNTLEKNTTGIGTTSYSYDGLDRLQTLTDPQGKVTTYAAYDKEDRLLEKRLPNSTHVDYVYNAAGWLTALNNRAGSGHGGGESSQSGLGDTTYTYDGSGKKKTEILPGAAGTRAYEYDAVGRLKKVVQGSTTRDYVYDKNSNRVDLRVNGTSTEAYTYNPLDQLTQVSGGAGTQTFTYNAAGELTTHALAGYVSPSKTRTGSVDSAVSPGFQSWRFDATAAGPVQATLSWSGSADLNLELRKIEGNSAILKAQAPGGQPETLTYEIPADSTGEYSLRVIAASGQATYTLDFSYPVAKTRTYTYDASGIPITEDNSLSNATYLVDGLDRVIRRTERTFEGAMTSDVKYAFEDADDSRVAEVHVTNGSVLATFASDLDGLLAVRRNGATTYNYYNGHGDLIGTADESGTPANPTPMTYDEFGGRPGGPYPYGWTGRQQRDTSVLTGTIRMGVRLYDPSLGRFLSRDAVEGGSLNDYEYAGGDPVNNLDLDGEAFLPILAGLARLVARPVARAVTKVVAPAVGAGLKWAAKKVVTGVAAAVRLRVTRPEPHIAHHYFRRGLLQGYRKHVQTTIYRKGVDASGRTLRIPYGRRYATGQHGR